MIAIDHSGKLVTVTVLGEFVLADYKEFETWCARPSRPAAGSACSSTCVRWRLHVDVAWEDIKYTRSIPMTSTRLPS